MIKNAVISTREELMMANTSLYTEFLNNYDVDNSIRPFIKGNGGGISAPTLEVKITERPTCAPVNPTIKPITPTSKPTIRPFRPIEPFPELVIGYIIKDKPTLDWDVFKTYDIPDSNQYVEYDSYTCTFKKFDKLENATAYWTEFLQDKTILDNSIKRLEQKKSNKIWDFYSYNIDNSYISKLYDEMYMSFTNVRRYNEISQNIIKSFDQYTEKTDLVAFEFEGLSEFETNIIETGGSTDVTKGKLNIHVKHKKLKNIDYYVTATNGAHVDYDGTIYFVNNNVSYVTAYLSADPSIYKTVAVKPSQLVKIPGEQDLTKTKEIKACLKSYNAHRMLRPLSLYTTSLLFDETYNESVILHHADWNLMDEFGHYDDYQCRIEFNIGGKYELCTKAEPIVRTSQFNSLHISVANRMYIHGSVDVIDDTHMRLYLTALDVTAQLFNSSDASYRITIFKYKRDNNNKIIPDVEEELITFDAKLSCKRLYPTGALRPKIRLMDPLNFKSSLSADNVKNENNNFSQTFKASQNTIITVTSKDTLSSKLVSLSIEPANGNATALVPKVKRDGDAFKIYCFGKGSYKINYSLYHESDNYIDDTDNYSIIISDYPYIVNKDFDSLKNTTILSVNTYTEQIEGDSSIKKMGITCSLNVSKRENIIPASIIGQFNTFNEDSRTNTSSFATESEIDYIYTDYDYSQINDGKLLFTVWYKCTKEYSNVSPLRIYFVNIDNSIIYFDYSPEIAKSFKVSRAFMFFGLIDDFTDYGKDLTQELYAISKQNKISGFIKVSLGLSDKPWTSSLVKEVVRPIYDPFITNLQNKYIAKFTAAQVSYINRLRKTTQNLSLQNEKITNYLASQNLTSTYTSYVLSNSKLSYIEKIDAKKQITNAYIFNTAALGLSVIEEDNDVLSPWNVSPQITIDNPTVYYNLNEYYGKVRKGCMYKTTEKNYDLDISKNPKFDTDLDSVGITITISKTDQIKVEFTFEQIYAMINGKKENIYCIDKNSLKIAGTIDGKRVELKYVNGCSWNKTTGKVTISEDKSFNLVFGILNSRKRINLTFVVDEYYQVLDDIVIEDYDVYCGDGSPLNNLGGLAFKDSSYLLDVKKDNSENIKNIKNAIKLDKYAYAHVWVDSTYLTGVERIVSNLIVGSAKVQSSTNISSSEEGISAQEDKPKIAYFGTFSLRDDNLIFEKNYVLENSSVAKIIQPLRLPFRYVSDENIKWLVSGARQLNILEDHDYDICLNLNSDNGGFDKFKTSAYNIRILCKNRLILIASDVNKYSSFTFNYKKNYDKYGFITALCIFDANDNLVQTYMLNTSFFPYTKATIVLERIHQTPIYYYNDALSEYKENGDYDNLLPSFTFYKDKVDQKFTCTEISAYCNSYVGLISIMPLRYKDNFRTLMDNMSISVLNNKVCAIQQLENLAVSNTIITGSKPDNLNKTKRVSISNVLKIDGIKTEGKAVTKHIPDTIQYIGYLMYYYNMLYLRDLGWVMNDDCDSEDMIYYMIMLDKLKHQSDTFSKFRTSLFDDNGKAKYGNQIDIYDTDLASKLDWKTTIGYIEYFNKFKSNILKYWEDRIDAYNILEEVLGAYDSRLTVTEQIDKYLDILGDDGTKRKKIYFILTTENGEDKWAVSQINNRIYQQDALFYIWSNVYQIMFDGVFDFDLINDAIIRDIYNYGLFPEIEIPEMDNEGFFVPYKVNRNGKVEKSTNGWDGSGDEKYKYILDENNFIIGIDADIDLPENEQKVRYWEFSQLSDFNGWGSYEIVGADKDGWGKLMKDGKEYVLTIKGKIVERKKRTNSTDVYHSKFGFLRNGKQYIRYRRRLDNKAPQSVHATYFGDCKEYWLDENKSNIIKTNKRSLITGIRLQRFLCELFISELNKTTYMVDVIQKFFEINNALGRLKTDWREILNKKLKKDDNTEENKIDVFTQEIKYPLVDFNLKEFSFEHKCIYPEDRTLQGVLSYTFNYYCWDDHKIKEEDGAEYMNIDIPEYSLQRQIVHESQIYDDYFSLSITIPQNIGIYRKGIGKFNFTATYIRFDGNEDELTDISTYSISNSDSTYHSNIKGVLVKPAKSTGIEPFIIYPWNINKNTSTIIDSDDNNDNISYTNLYEPVCWSSTIADLSGLPNYSDYDRLSRYVDVDTSGLRNTEVIMAKIKSGELKDAPAAELCYNYDGGEFVKTSKNDKDISYIIENKLQKNRLITYTYTITYSYGINYNNSFSYYNMWAYNNISSPILKPVMYVSDAELSKYPLCEYSVNSPEPIYEDDDKNKRILGSKIVATYIYKYIAPNITYQVTASCIKKNYQTVISYYNKYHLKYKEETQLGPDNVSFPIPKSTKVSQPSEETTEIAAFSMRATAESFQDNRTTLYMTVSRLDELMMYDDGLSNVSGGGGGRINASTTKIYATLDPTIELTIPPIITRPVPTIKPTLLPKPTIIISVEPTIRPIITSSPTNIPTIIPSEELKKSVFSDKTIDDIITNASIKRVYRIYQDGNVYRSSYLYKSDDLIIYSSDKEKNDRRKFFTDEILSKFIGIENSNVGDEIIVSYINNYIMKYGFKDLVLGVTYYNSNGFVEYEINNDYKIIDETEEKRKNLRDTFGFYLGSVSQWQIVQDNVKRINTELYKINKELKKLSYTYTYTYNLYPEVDYFYEGKYADNKYCNRLFWTSSEIDKDEAWPMFFDQYYCGLNNKLTSAYVRPFMTYKEPSAQSEEPQLSRVTSVETK